MRKRAWRLVTLMGFFGALGSAQPSTAADFWLRVESRMDSTFPCQGSESETLIFHDGLVTRKSVAQDGAATFTRMQAPPEAVWRLADALARNRVGFAPGDCAVDFVQPNASFAFTITWFGRAGRTHTFSVTSPSGEPCPASTDAIFAAIDEILRVASTAPGAVQVELPLAPVPPCGEG